MGRSIAGVLYVFTMAGALVAVDVLFFRGHVLERLAANVGIVLVFVAFHFDSPSRMSGASLIRRPLAA